ncbi:MAG: formate--phosphoribosylaminoimidazolecarboxamide ligase family protein [Thaumarchaeota archaeon]|jgi:5-formaminoimidazole-4-carboxamide-1-(beta)-D-ribofuranosyl 5'-monophosphate synthetase|nr:formate--phosphoribosylaminoimidazolecarboxamide ligase family protein [Candidatus Geocrenenecus arthurdayi]MCL7401727.1 formate--phosphoribosylaminoimidazolecarboxamide ligase family protein [Candidatus Geocrenenecus arthurdayi]
MKRKDEITSILGKYSKNQLTIGILGTHSALEVCRGAKDEGFKTVVICQKKREKIYSNYFISRERFGKRVGIIDDVIILERFRDIARDEVQEELRRKNTILIPHRGLSVYVGYEVIENMLRVPIFGNRYLLKIEERGVDFDQYKLLDKAGIPYPRIYRSPDEIDRPVIVKVSEAVREYERAFFLASSPREFEEKSRDLIEKKLVTRQAIEKAVIEELIVGAYFNFNFFYSPLDGEIELLGIDMRRQTNLDGLLRLPVTQQLEVLKFIEVRNIEVGHIACTIRESLLERAFELAERFVKTTQDTCPPGVIGPFALQSIVVPGPPQEEIIVYDVSVRVPGSPGVKFTPYSENLWGFPISVGRRIAMEIKEALREDRLEEVLT